MGKLQKGCVVLMNSDDRFYVAAVQMNSQDDVEKNLKNAGKLIDSAVAGGAALVALPEYSSYLSDHKVVEHAESLEGEIVTFFRKKAKETGVYLHCGSFIEKSDDVTRAYNTSVLIDPGGEIVTSYRKIHLFDVNLPGQASIMESKNFKAGQDIIVAETDLGPFGFALCYDLRFPELFRALVDQGARLVFVPAAFTLYTGKDHWEVLLRARAVENQVYIVAPAQFGVHPDNKTCFGASMIIDPWGTVIARASEGTGHGLAPIDWSLLEKFRQRMPSLKHRTLKI